MSETREKMDVYVCGRLRTEADAVGLPPWFDEVTLLGTEQYLHAQQTVGVHYVVGGGGGQPGTHVGALHGESKER